MLTLDAIAGTLSLPGVLLTAGQAQQHATASASGGITEDLLQLVFLALVIGGCLFAALYYVGNLLVAPWARALSNTDRQAVINAVMIAGIALLTGIYTLTEPGRLKSASARHEEESVHRGMLAFGQYCVSCHGLSGAGGPVPPELAKGAAGFAPPLANRPDFRPENATERDQKREVLRKVIARGRNLMPAWAIEEGGGLNAQEVEDVVAFLQHGNFADVAGSMPKDQVASVQATAVALGGAAVEKDAPPGKALFVSKGCVACHVVQGIPGGGAVGPNLSKVGANPQIVGLLPMSKDNMVRWLANPPAVKAGTTMPNLSLSVDEQEKLADYLLSLK